MRDFSQNGEQRVILDYFKDKKGTVLDLGANDGIILSNSYALIQSGWAGVLVEASPVVFKTLEYNHQNSADVFLYNFAISDQEGEIEFYESGTHLKQGDLSLLSTIKPAEMERWKGTDTVFTPKKVPAITFKSFQDVCPIKKYEFITVDIEGMDYVVLTQMDLNEIGCEMLCIETNSVDDHKYIDYCKKFGMRVIHKNHENLIFAR